MKFLVLSKSQAIKYTSLNNKEPYIMISISEDPLKPVELVHNNSMLAVLRLYFDDVIIDDIKYMPMSSKDGKDIQEFVDQWKDKVNTIIVHCFAGISRSAGVAGALSLLLNGTDEWIWKSKKYIPNTYCYNMVLKAYGVDLHDYLKYKWEREIREDSEI